MPCEGFTEVLASPGDRGGGGGQAEGQLCSRLAVGPEEHASDLRCSSGSRAKPARGLPHSGESLLPPLKLQPTDRRRWQSHVAARGVPQACDGGSAGAEPHSQKSRSLLRSLHVSREAGLRTGAFLPQAWAALCCSWRSTCGVHRTDAGPGAAVLITSGVCVWCSCGSFRLDLFEMVFKRRARDRSHASGYSCWPG